MKGKNTWLDTLEENVMLNVSYGFCMCINSYTFRRQKTTKKANNFAQI